MSLTAPQGPIIPQNWKVWFTERSGLLTPVCFSSSGGPHRPDAPAPLLSPSGFVNHSNQWAPVLKALRWTSSGKRTAATGPEAKQGLGKLLGGGQGGEGKDCPSYVTVGLADTPRLFRLEAIPILRSFCLSYNKQTSTLTCTSSSYIPRKEGKAEQEFTAFYREGAEQSEVK